MDVVCGCDLSFELLGGLRLGQLIGFVFKWCLKDGRTRAITLSTYNRW